MSSMFSFKNQYIPYLTWPLVVQGRQFYDLSLPKLSVIFDFHPVPSPNPRNQLYTRKFSSTEISVNLKAACVMFYKNLEKKILICKILSIQSAQYGEHQNCTCSRWFDPLVRHYFPVKNNL